MKPETVNKVFKWIFYTLFVLFIVVYSVSISGYNEQQERQRVNLTEEKIRAFEQDIKDGKKIDLDAYIEEKNNFDDKPKRIGLKISEIISKYMRKGIQSTFRILNNIVES
ncbi:MAG: hypothetical protein PHO63_02385 [Bacilli bacterium]|nr:hypothetical protein [Bacilli bacterium]MDD4809478.1 hypothetical protein [Bacilli bacterium]